MAKLCMGCMNPLPEGTTACSICGFDPATDKNPEHCLPLTTALQGHYIVGRFMGAYSDHLLYLAYDRQLREPCFIQEFFPEGICHRDTIGGVQPNEGADREYENYADWFRNNMRTLARMRELPALVPVYDIFEENGTVYAASDYCQGMTLTKKIKLSGGRMPWSEVRPLFMPLLSTLAQLNDAGIYHMAICPDNIIIGADGKARLRNFSIPAAHQMGTGLTADLQAGFAAPEQYHSEAAVAGYTDVYGVAATLFRAVSGNDLPAGDSRAEDSDDLFMSAEVAQELTQPVCAALFNALLVSTEDRTATVAILRDQLSTTPNVAALVTEAEQDMGMATEEEPADHRLRNMLIVFGSCLGGLLLLVAAFFFFLTDAGRAIIGLDEGVSDSMLDDVKLPGNLPSGWNDPNSPNYIPYYDPTNPSYNPNYNLGNLGSTTTDPSDYGDELIEAPKVIDANYYDLRDSVSLPGRVKLVLSEMRLDEAEAGTILEQDPAPGTMIPSGSEIRVVISYGSVDEVIEVPDVAGWEQNQATKYLEACGFRVVIEKVQSTAQKKGYVVGTDPRVGTEKRKGDTIILRVSDTEATTTTTTPPTTTTTTTLPSETTTSTTMPTESTTESTESTTVPTESTTETGGEATEPTEVIGAE